jgi:hypothetical protein
VIEPVAIEQHAPEHHVAAVTDSAQDCAGEPLDVERSSARASLRSRLPRRTFPKNSRALIRMLPVTAAMVDHETGSNRQRPESERRRRLYAINSPRAARRACVSGMGQAGGGSTM